MLSSLFVENTRKRLCRLRRVLSLRSVPNFGREWPKFDTRRREKTDFILFAALNCELCETGFL